MDDQAEVIAFLSKPQAYGLEAGEVECHQTHGSIVFLIGERAYKLKRAVRYPYMDYSTVERRKAMCESELRVNRRLAPELYVDVRPVVRATDGSLRIGRTDEGGQPIDWLVEMRRFAQDTLFESLRRRNKLALPLIRALAENVASFHRGAEIHKDFGGADGIANVIDENVRLFRQMEGQPFGSEKIGRWEALARNALNAMRSLLEARREGGFVRRCHGDLHLNNICLLSGRPILFDAIEFRDDFACIDVIYDLAFLLMDLDRHGLRAHANVLFNRYLERSGDYAGLAALPLFLSCRAGVRAHVTVSAARLDPGGASNVGSQEAIQLLDRAIQYLEPRQTRLVVVGGLSGTGKSTLAANIAPLIGRAPGAVVLRTDVVRKQLWGVDELSRLPAPAYAMDFTKRVYAAIAERAALILRSGCCVVADAVFGSPDEHVLIENVARDVDVPFAGLWLDAPVAVLEQRLAGRHNDASDATIEVLRAQLAHVRKPANWITLDAGGSAAELHAKAARALDAVQTA